MATDEEIERATEELQEKIDDLIDDTDRWTQEESLEIVSTLEFHCRMRAQAIREDLAR